MKLYLNSTFHKYLYRCWPMMPAKWSVAANSIDFVGVELDPKDQDEMVRYMNMDLRYSESDDDERGQILTHAMYAFIASQIQLDTEELDFL